MSTPSTNDYRERTGAIKSIANAIQHLAEDLSRQADL